MIRPLSDVDLRTVAAYLHGTDEDVRIALSELGFDPQQYPQIRKWLKSISLVFNDTWQWETDE
jgi:hypothetical protein